MIFLLLTGEMQKGKNIILLFFMPAVVVMLMNTVRSHHHHHNQECFIADHCHEWGEGPHEDEHHHDGYDHSHSHPANGPCKVSSIYIIPSSQRTHGNTFSSWAQDTHNSTVALLDILAGIDHQGGKIFTSFSAQGKSLSKKAPVLALRGPPFC